MSQTFVKDFDPSDNVSDTMESSFDNTKTLKSSFSGPSSPSDAEKGMLWADTLNNILKVRGTSSWLPVLNMGTGEVFIEIGQIGSDQIANDARKPSIIQGEHISPSECDIKAKAIPPVGLPNVAANEVSFSLLYSSGWKTVRVYRTYIPANAATLSMHAMFQRAKGRFGLSTSQTGGLSFTSSETNYVSSTGWTSSPSGLALGSVSGWYFLQVQGKTDDVSQGGNEYGYSFSFVT